MDSTDQIRNLCFTMAEQLEGARVDLSQHLGELNKTMESFLSLGKDLDGSGAVREGAEAQTSAFPASLLAAPDTSGLDGVGKIVADAMLQRWDAALQKFFDDPNRIYLPREMKKLVRLARDKKIGAVQPSDIERAATVAFQRDLVEQSKTFRVKRAPQGDKVFTYRPTAGNHLLTFIVRLLEDDGAFEGMENRMRELWQEEQDARPGLAATPAAAPSAAETDEYRLFLKACGFDDQDERWW